MTLLAATDWPDAAIAIAGIAFVTIVFSVALWQIFGTGRTAIRSKRGEEYRKLVDELSAVQRETTAELQQTNAALSHPARADRGARSERQRGRPGFEIRGIEGPTDEFRQPMPSYPHRARFEKTVN